jgi:hypothetical protein
MNPNTILIICTIALVGVLVAYVVIYYHFAAFAQTNNGTTNTTANSKACIKYKQSVLNLTSPDSNFSGTSYDIAHIKAEYNLNCKNITGVLAVNLSTFLGGSP